MKKLLIFDCDGVLVDSEIIANRIDAEALTAIGYPITAEESIRKFTGLNIKAVNQIIQNESDINIPCGFWSSRQQAILEAFEIGLAPLIRPVLEMIEELNIERCVASSSPKNRVLRCLELTGQIKFFNEQSIFTSQQVSKGKPAPDLFLFAAKQMECSAKNCIVIEDSIAGIEAAQSAGMHVIAFLGGSHSKYDWYQERVSIYNVPIAKTPHDLLLTLTSWLRPNPSICNG